MARRSGTQPRFAAGRRNAHGAPQALCRCTPVAVKAKAGLSLLGASWSAKVLGAVRRHLSTSTEYPFQLASQDEGVFVWVMANYFIVTSVVVSLDSE